ncbi:DNA-binding protein [Variovorax sp. LjRoot290]|uniref:DNA-binding protein n=1 Tax=Variovorax sp. LjRoot290 TaxID=3342316 RepID=UPI003F512BC8
MQSASTSVSRHQSGTASRPRPGRPGIQLEDVLGAADALVAEGIKPTIERVRMRLGGGSPNTVSAHLDEWFARLPARLVGMQAPAAAPRDDEAPLSVVQAAHQFWDVARREADQVQVQKTEATRRELELERDALALKEAELKRREDSFEQARVKLDDALASSKQAVEAMQAQMHVQQQESARMLSDSEAEVRRLRKALDGAVASKEALREKAAMELDAKQRAADEAEERHLGQERRLLSEIDRERMATRQATAELAREQKARAADLEIARSAQEAAKHAAAAWSQQHQELQLELATLRERAAGADQRATDLVSQLQRQQEQSDREIAQLRESHAATAAALRQLEARGKGQEAPKPARPRKPSK